MIKLIGTAVNEDEAHLFCYHGPEDPVFRFTGVLHFKDKTKTARENIETTTPDSLGLSINPGDCVYLTKDKCLLAWSGKDWKEITADLSKFDPFEAGLEVLKIKEAEQQKKIACMLDLLVIS